MNNNNNNIIAIVSQAFYGNRVGTEIHKKDVDRFILGYQDDTIVTEPIDRTIVNIPNTDGIVIVYNKHREDNEKKNNHGQNPLAIIPEENIEIYSRCIACRIDEHGELVSLKEGDYNKIIKYFAE